MDNWINHARFYGIAATITGFFTSDEFQAKNLPQEVVVDKLYRSILGREGGDDEKNIQLDRLKSGLTIHIIVNDLVGSDEYRRKAQLRAVPLPDMSVYSTLKIIFIYLCLISSISFRRPIFKWHSISGIPGFIKTLYQNILSRDPAEGACDAWANHTRSHGVASTFNEFFTSEELHNHHFPHEDIVDRLYRAILGRECNRKGDKKTDKCVQLRDGIAIGVIVNDLVGSEEYRKRVQLGVTPPADA